MNNWGANHGAISYGHIGADLITLAPCAHPGTCTTSRGEGLPPARLDRFGAMDPVGSTSAPANFGPYTASRDEPTR
jgi:L-fucose isomerase